MMETNRAKKDITASPERRINPSSIGIATTTFYRNWFPGEIKDYATVDSTVRTDKLRGDLALQTLREAKHKGFQIAVVDGGSSDAFREAVRQLEIDIQPEHERGMSSSRRQAFAEVSALEGVKVIVWTEPEKISVARDCLPEGVRPVLEGRADIVIPKRDAQAFNTYPDYQSRYEQRANALWNEILKKHGLLSPAAEELDVWFGVRFMRNDPAVLEHFMQHYDYYRTPPLFPQDDQQRKEIEQIYNPELWPDATFLPIISALYNKLRVESIPLHYEHPLVQTLSEQDSDEFRKKREIQYKNIIIASANLIKKLEGSSRSRFG